jgi:SAM-dependent methyltransferase
MEDGDKAFIDQNIDNLCCPKCGGDLAFREEGFSCLRCSQKYPILEGIPSLFWPNEWNPSKEDVTEKIKSFYEKTPFPNYDEMDSAASLIDKARKGIFAKLLDDQIPFGTCILESGCGTGQLTNFLSIASRNVVGTDLCIPSLQLARAFKEKNGLRSAHFFQMNLFRPCFKPNTFDLVISNGVLHHTSDPFLAFQSISRLVKPKGYLLVGLYHKYGRLITDLRRIIFRLTKDKLRFLDPRAITTETSPAKRNAWFMDQYKNPHESKHTFGEVLEWCDKTGFTFIHSIPKTVPFKKFDESERLFTPDRLGSKWDRFLVNLSMIFIGYKEGGFFIVVGKRAFL